MTSEPPPIPTEERKPAWPEHAQRIVRCARLVPVIKRHMRPRSQPCNRYCDYCLGRKPAQKHSMRTAWAAVIGAPSPWTFGSAVALATPNGDSSAMLATWAARMNRCLQRTLAHSAHCDLVPLGAQGCPIRPSPHILVCAPRSESCIERGGNAFRVGEGVRCASLVCWRFPVALSAYRRCRGSCRRFLVAPA